MAESRLGTMVSASIPDSTGHRDPSPREEGFFFLILLLTAERESASTANVGNYETDPLLEATRIDSDPFAIQSYASIDFDQ
jgi:hypothetical protein